MKGEIRNSEVEVHSKLLAEMIIKKAQENNTFGVFRKVERYIVTLTGTTENINKSLEKLNHEQTNRIR